MIFSNILTPSNSGKVPFFGMKKLNNWRVNQAPVFQNGVLGKVFLIYFRVMPH
jgi:hypothetical protein